MKIHLMEKKNFLKYANLNCNDLLSCYEIKLWSYLGRGVSLGSVFLICHTRQGVSFCYWHFGSVSCDILHETGERFVNRIGFCVLSQRKQGVHAVLQNHKFLYLIEIKRFYDLGKPLQNRNALFCP